MKVLVTGATGLVGQALLNKLTDQGHQVIAITRSQRKSAQQLKRCEKVIEHNLDQSPFSPDLISGVDAVIHLAGENVAAQRWNEEVKERILSSRKTGTENLIKSLPPGIKVFISASAIGFYGDRGEEILSEESQMGSGFLAEVCQQWEGASQSFPGRRVLMRTGVVLSPQGGALAKMKIPFMVGLGGPLGKGEMWMSWIHLDDLVDLFILALSDSKISGVYNAVAPEPVQNLEFSRSLAAVMRRPLGPAVPLFVLKMAMGEMSSVLLASQRVMPARLLQQKYNFRYQDVTQALMNLLHKN